MKIDKYMQNAKGDIVSGLVESEGYLVGIVNKLSDLNSNYVDMWFLDGRRLNGKVDLRPLAKEHPLAKLLVEKIGVNLGTAKD